MEFIEIITIILAVGIVGLPIILKVIEKKKNKKDNCTHVCSSCGKNCPLRDIKNNVKL